jgi:hypothetical protein
MSNTTLCLQGPTESDSVACWLESYRSVLLTYVIVAAVVFAALTVMAATNLTRLIFFTGCRPTTSKAMHAVIAVQAVLSLAWVLAAGLGMLGGTLDAAHSVWAAVLESAAAALSLVLVVQTLWLGLHTQPVRPWVSAGLWVVGVAAPVGLVVLGGLAASSHALVQAARIYAGLWYLLLAGALLGLAVRRRRSAARSEQWRLSVFVSVLLLALTLLSLPLFLLELYYFAPYSWTSWLVQSIVFDCVQAALAVGTFVFLGRIGRHEVSLERQALVGKGFVELAGERGAQEQLYQRQRKLSALDVRDAALDGENFVTIDSEDTY